MTGGTVFTIVVWVFVALVVVACVLLNKKDKALKAKKDEKAKRDQKRV